VVNTLAYSKLIVCYLLLIFVVANSPEFSGTSGFSAYLSSVPDWAVQGRKCPVLQIKYKNNTVIIHCECESKKTNDIFHS